MPRRPHDVAPEHLVLRLRRRERTKVVLAEQQVGGILQTILGERARIPPRAPLLERRRRTATPDPVAVAAGARGVTRVEVRCRLLRRDDGYVIGQRGVE